MDAQFAIGEGLGAQLTAGAAIVILGVLMAVAAGAFGSIKKNNAKKQLDDY